MLLLFIKIFYKGVDNDYLMHFIHKVSYTLVLLGFSLCSIVGISFYQMSYATICFDCPEADLILDEAKKSIDNGDYSGAKNHIDHAKQLIGNSTATNHTGNQTN